MHSIVKFYYILTNIHILYDDCICVGDIIITPDMQHLVLNVTFKILSINISKPFINCCQTFISLTSLDGCFRVVLILPGLQLVSTELAYISQITYCFIFLVWQVQRQLSWQKVSLFYILTTSTEAFIQAEAKEFLRESKRFNL